VNPEQDTSLAEEIVEGDTFWGSRRLAAIQQVLKSGANQTFGAAAGASALAVGKAGEMMDAVRVPTHLPSTLNPQPSTLDPRPSTLNPQPLNP
jgi:hypothetical protein